MYKYIYPISKLLMILLVTLVSRAIIGTLMEAADAQDLEVFAISASSRSLAPESDLSRKSTSQLDNPLSLNAALAASDGVFNPFTVYASGSWAEAVVSGEWNGDGKNDVMLVTGLDFDDASPPLRNSERAKRRNGAPAGHDIKQQQQQPSLPRSLAPSPLRPRVTKPPRPRGARAFV